MDEGKHTSWDVYIDPGSQVELGPMFSTVEIGKRHQPGDPYFTMIKLSSGGVFAEQHPDLLLLSDEDEKETGRGCPGTNFWCGSCFSFFSAECKNSPLHGWHTSHTAL